MQFLSTNENMKLIDLADAVGSRNVSEVLVANRLPRVPDIGRKFAQICTQIALDTQIAAVSVARKTGLLNTLTSDSEIYEKAALMDEGEWKVFAELNTFPDALRIPSSVTLPSSAQTIGNNQSVSSSVYQKTMKQLKEKGKIDPATFSDYASGSLGPAHSNQGSTQTNQDIFSAFNIPWGEIQLYSSISGEVIDFPCYPEEVDYTRGANYAEMETTLYQYEPWYAYESSGPREQSITFMLHRDMWTGDHRDGKCNELIRFCEANCYADYNGAAVNSPIVTLYIHGTAFISGVMTQVNPHWQGPIGLDGWYLQCELTITINEVASAPLNYQSIRKMNVIGGYNE